MEVFESRKTISVLIDPSSGIACDVHFLGGSVLNPWCLRDLPHHVEHLTSGERVQMVHFLQEVVDRLALVPVDTELRRYYLFDSVGGSGGGGGGGTTTTTDDAPRCFQKSL